MSTEPWHIQMLGGLVLRRGGESVSNFPTEKARLLLAYLAANLHLTPTREELVERFWPESDIDAGRVSLRQALAQVRRILEPVGVAPGTFLIADRTKVCLNAELFVTDMANWDRSRALANRAEGSERLRLLEAALPYYGGEFVPGAYMEWVLQERQHRQEQYVDLLLQLADAQMEHGRYMAARESAQVVLRIDAFDEEAHDRLIRAFALEGNLVLARRQYEKLCKLLQEELHLDPSPRLKALYAGLEQLSRSRPEAESLPGATSSSKSLASIAAAPMETPRLPLRLTRFFGRTEELRQLQEWLNDPSLRLITLTGIGGVGKTRLSLEAAQLATRFGASITFVPLSETPLPELLLPAILQNLCLPAFTPTDPLIRLRSALGAQPHLLVLDNFEQIAESAAETLWQLLEQIPTVACLITSRQPLNLPGEHELAIAPLPVPDSRWTADNLSENPTVQLLVDRIRASRPDFHLTSANAASVAALCTRLEGIPLAVELASGWARDLTIGQMQERMSQRFQLLVSRQRGVPPRHQSLRATVESSFQLLSPPLQRFFLRLSVFCGGWCAEAAQIGEDPEESLFSVPAQDALRVLREQSLITAHEVREDHIRYGMLETLRDFAWEQLPPPEQEEMRRRHALYWMTYSEATESKLNGPELPDRLNRLEEERANLTATLTWCLESPVTDALAPSPTEIGLRISGALWRFWEIRGSVQEGRQFTERLLERADAGIEPKVLARAHASGGALAKAASDYPGALAHGKQSLSYWRQIGSLVGICSALSNTGMYLSELGHWEESLRYYNEGLTIMRELGIEWRIAIFLNNIGSVQRQMGDFEAAKANLQEALTLRRKIGDLRAIWSTLNNLAALAHHQDDFTTAVQRQQEALTIARELEDRYAIGISLVNLGGNYLSLKDLTVAYACFMESLQLHTEVASRFGQAYALEGLAMYAALTDRPERAGVLLGATQALREAIQARQSPQEQEQMDAPFLPIAADPLFLDGLARGRTLPLETVIALATS